MASPSPGDRRQADHSVKHDRKKIYCNHCKKEVSKSTYYRHKRQHLDSESELSERSLVTTVTMILSFCGLMMKRLTLSSVIILPL